MATQENMVLRTVYLPKDLDQRLRSMAFSDEKTKGELMRELILEALAAREAKVPAAEPVKITSKSKLEVVRPAPRRQRAPAGSRAPVETKELAEA